MENHKELYSYSALLASQPDLDNFPDERWQELKEGIKEEQHEFLISDTANRLDLYWPKSGSFTTLTVSDCLLSTLSRLLGMKSMGNKKALTIMRILTYLHENPDERQSTSGVKRLSPHELIDQTPADWRSISNQHWEEICQLIPKRYYNKTIQALANDMGLVWPERNWGSWTVYDFFTESFEDLTEIKGVGRKKLETITKVFIRLTDPDFRIPQDSDSEPQDIWSHPVIINLSDQKREIFEKRLLTVYEKPTLQELGSQYKVTRERIRQIESGIKKQIAASGLKAHLKKILDNYIKNKLHPEYTGRRYLLTREVPEIVSTLSPELVLAIALNYKSIYQLLSAKAKEAPTGWYFGKRSEFNKMTRRLDKELEDFLPAPIESLAQKFEIEKADLIAICLLSKVAVLRGPLLLPRRSGRADANRAAQCFDAAIINNQRFWSINDLIYQASKESSSQSQRLYQISISRCQRLFLSTPAYTTLIDHSIQIETAIDSPETLRDEGDEEEEEVVNESENDNLNLLILGQLLEKEWPITGKNIREYTSQEPYQTDLADNSLIVSLCSLAGCTRLAPGIYGPMDYINHPAKLKKARKLTMNEGNIRAYCFARRSGEKCEEIFPLWNPRQEQIWFRKLQKKNEDNPLLRSFISVAQQKEWPEQLEAETLKLMEHTVSAKFLLEPSWIKNRSYNVPDLATTLTALRYANEVAPLSWIRANHITCVWQLAEESGVSVLICGLALGLLDSTKRPWWKPIPPSKDFDANWERIQSTYMDKDIPDWNHPVIQEYFEEARELAANKKLGFVKRESLDQFINSLKITD